MDKLFWTYRNIAKIATSPGDNYTNGCLLDYPYFKEFYKLIATDLGKQQVLDADPIAAQQVNFTGNLCEEATVFFIIEKVTQTILDFSQVTLRIL